MNYARNIVAMIAAMLFTMLVLVTLIVVGADWARRLALIAAALAAASQFTFQDVRPIARYTSIFLAYCAFVTMLLAVAFY